MASDGASALLCVDEEPPAGGALGQIVTYHGNAAIREVIFPSLTSLVAAYADALDRGEYAYEPYVGIVAR